MLPTTRIDKFDISTIVCKIAYKYKRGENDSRQKRRDKKFEIGRDSGKGFNIDWRTGGRGSRVRDSAFPYVFLHLSPIGQPIPFFIIFTAE